MPLTHYYFRIEQHGETHSRILLYKGTEAEQKNGNLHFLAFASLRSDAVLHTRGDLTIEEKAVVRDDLEKAIKCALNERGEPACSFFAHRLGVGGRLDIEGDWANVCGTYVQKKEKVRTKG